MAKYRFWAIIMIALAIVAGFFIWNSQKPDASRKFKLGLDLSGGTHLVYKADTSEIQSGDISGAMQSLRDTIERRVNLFGVSEPIVQIEEGGVLGGQREQRLIVELPGITDVNEAIKRIGETPTLEFKILSKEGQDKIKLEGETLDKASVSSMFLETGLTGRMLQKASIQFDQNFANKPIIGLKFNEEGADLFDVFVPWKNSAGQTVTERYFHCFTKRELKKTIKKAGFKIEKIWRAGQDPRTNIYLIARK